MAARKILADHLFKRYFDLGMGFDPIFPEDTLYSLQSIYDIVSHQFSVISTPSSCRRIADDIFGFAQSTPTYALEILSEMDDEYRIVVDDLHYTCSGSRYDFAPSTLSQRQSRTLALQEATTRECRKCDEVATRMWIERTGNFSLASAFEAIKRGRVNSP